MDLPRPAASAAARAQHTTVLRNVYPNDWDDAVSGVLWNIVPRPAMSLALDCFRWFLLAGKAVGRLWALMRLIINTTRPIPVASRDGPHNAMEGPSG